MKAVADLSAITVPTDPGVKPRKFGTLGQHHRRRSSEDIASAMVACRGNAAQAAKMLEMNVTNLYARIKKTPVLYARFSPKAKALTNTMALQKLADAGERTPTVLDIAARQVEEMMIGQKQLAQEALDMTKKLKARLEKGDLAREMVAAVGGKDKLNEHDEIFVKMHGFQENEEQMLFDQIQRMMQEYSRLSESCATVSYRQAQINKLNRMGSKSNKPLRALGVPPKGSSPATTVIHNAGGQIAILGQPPKEATDEPHS